MAKALKYPTVFRALLDGGHICERAPITGKHKWTVSLNLKRIGHITENQFIDMYNAGLLHYHSTRQNKSGEVLNYYTLLEG